ncbi:MAG: helix-turn-helix transcriptional regulator [Candidatus Heimdallarchaeota archaeon]
MVPNLSVSNLGAYIHSLRKGHRHTQLELAKEINITQTMLSKYELNDTTIPIADLLQIFFYKILLLSFLSKYSKLHLHSQFSHCLLDTQPNKLLPNYFVGYNLKSKDIF